MIWAFLGIVLGVLLGVVLNVDIPTEYARYTAVIILGMGDAIFGALRAEIHNDKFSPIIFISGIIFNILLAVGITALGDQLGLDLYLAATIVFTFRIFANLGVIRRTLMERFRHNKKEHHGHVPEI